MSEQTKSQSTDFDPVALVERMEKEATPVLYYELFDFLFLTAAHQKAETLTDEQRVAFIDALISRGWSLSPERMKAADEAASRV